MTLRFPSLLNPGLTWERILTPFFFRTHIYSRWEIWERSVGDSEISSGTCGCLVSFMGQTFPRSGKAAGKMAVGILEISPSESASVPLLPSERAASLLNAPGPSARTFPDGSPPPPFNLFLYYWPLILCGESSMALSSFICLSVRPLWYCNCNSVQQIFTGLNLCWALHKAWETKAAWSGWLGAEGQHPRQA